MSLNKWFGIGNVGRDPEIRDVSGTKVASFSLAITDRYKDRNGEVKENTEWVSIVAWRSSAEFIEKYVTKGMQVHIEGKIKTRKYTTQSGEERSVTEVVVDHIQPLGKKEGSKERTASTDEQSKIPPQFRDDAPQDDGDIPF